MRSLNVSLNLCAFQPRCRLAVLFAAAIILGVAVGIKDGAIEPRKRNPRVYDLTDGKSAAIKRVTSSFTHDDGGAIILRQGRSPRWLTKRKRTAVECFDCSKHFTKQSSRTKDGLPAADHARPFLAIRQGSQGETNDEPIVGTGEDEVTPTTTTTPSEGAEEEQSQESNSETNARGPSRKKLIMGVALGGVVLIAVFSFGCVYCSGRRRARLTLQQQNEAEFKGNANTFVPPVDEESPCDGMRRDSVPWGHPQEALNRLHEVESQPRSWRSGR